MSTIFVVVGSLLSAVFGTLALLTPFRDNAGNIRGQSWAVIGGLVSAAALTITGNVLSRIQGDRDTASRHEALLRTLWKDSNRISPNDVRILVSFPFDLRWVRGEDIPDSPPTLFDDAWRLELRLTSNYTPTHNDQWYPGPMIDPAEVVLPARSQTVTRRRFVDESDEAGYPVTRHEQISAFDQFTGELQRYEQLEGWNGAFVEIDLISYAPSTMRDWFARIDPEQQSEFQAAFKKLYPDHPDYRNFLPLGLPVKATILVRNRPVTSIAGLLYMSDASPSSEVIVARLPVVQLPQTIGSTFEPSAQSLVGPPHPTERATTVLGWILTVIVVGFSIVALLGLRPSERNGRHGEQPTGSGTAGNNAEHRASHAVDPPKISGDAGRSANADMQSTANANGPIERSSLKLSSRRRGTSIGGVGLFVASAVGVIAIGSLISRMRRR